jgi:hypothetical protein
VLILKKIKFFLKNNNYYIFKYSVKEVLWFNVSLKLYFPKKLKKYFFPKKSVKKKIKNITKKNSDELTRIKW